MAVNFLLKRSDVANKRPTAASMQFGEVNLNYDAATGGLYYRNDLDEVVKIGPCEVSATAPNASPAVGGSAGNSTGEFWYDTANSTLYVFDGTSWVETGGAVQGVTGTAPITVDNTDPLNPIVGIDYATDSADGSIQLATDAEVQAGVESTHAVTPSGLQSKVSDSVSTTSSTTIASSTAVKDAYDLADAALARSGGTMTGTITFAAGQLFPVSGIQDATTGQKGVVQIGTNIDVASGVISVATATTTVLGLVSVGSNIEVSAGEISVLSATTSQPGVVQLNDTTTSTSTTEALTANQGKLLQDQINALAVSSNLTYAGTIDASTGLVSSVSTEGSSAGFTVGQALPAAAAGNAEYFVIVDVPGTFTPPGGSSVAANDGDWFISNGTTTYTYIPAGWTPIYASETEAGLVELATNAEVQSGLDTSRAVTPAGLQSKVSDSVSTTSSTTIASSTAVKDAYDLADTIYNGTFNTTARPTAQLLQTSSTVAAADQLGLVVDSSDGQFYSVTAFDAGTF